MKVRRGADEPRQPGASRREFLKGAAAGVGALTGAACATPVIDLEAFFQKNLRQLSDADLAEIIARLERKYSEEYGRPVKVAGTRPYDGVVFGYGLDVDRCIGCRRCVAACVEENNQSRDPEIHWIRVLEFEREHATRGMILDEGNPFYDHERVPAEGMLYLPVACQQCEDPPCTKACPTRATWQEPDGIVVIDYDWCIGCRYCMAACPYGARHFNWTEPGIAEDELNPDTHILGNRPRAHGVVEKCTFCVQRTREGRYPACLEACPVGARKFGNLLDPDSELRYLMKHKRTFVLKPDLHTRPKFFYFHG